MTKGPESAPNPAENIEASQATDLNEAVDAQLDIAEVDAHIHEAEQATYFSGGRMNIQDALDDMSALGGDAREFADRFGDAESFEDASGMWDHFRDMWNNFLKGIFGTAALEGGLDLTSKAPKLAFRGFEFPGGVKPVVTSMPQAWRDVEGNGASSHGGHQGVDIAVPKGTDILMAQHVKIIGVSDRGEAGGRTVRVKYPDGSEASFSHMNSIAVSVGQAVAPGGSIGEVGESGNATGPHIHYQTYNPDKTLRDPFTSFDARLAGVDLSGYSYPFEGMTRKEARRHSSEHRHA